MNINWFPGHMAKARRKITESLKLVDAVCEITDARIPASSCNPELDEITAGKPRLIVLNRADLADSNATRAWAKYFTGRGFSVLETDSKSGKGVKAFPGAVRELLKDKIAAREEKGQTGRPIRVMVVGIPNVGKSTFINKVSGRKAAAASDRPGVTRAQQWIPVGGIELLDTPGVLWPKFDSPEVGENLAFTGAIRDEIMDRVTLGANLLSRLSEAYADRIEARYKFTPQPDMSGFDLLEAAAKKRGFLISGGEYDLERMACVLLDEYRGGLLGRITLERPQND
ncbi:MAG: ribosome biogenesis GTPase YlqF [Oscillospiraceae bacterium]|nr:ribosome biogenesis GTPase YlqF [Oscillospiraceae bacterium]